ncbi:hypothetical protein ROLI_039690 [Roseobacter fucihabitans]|uniref:Band 7 domain-containing protein n=1 Tax=Roseobacter fucihabitans TaxID=1537242 RepID=A0ABZ2BXY3_9RHOB|nr:hypothetical protein [Roseobacter litoralis]MBC6964928.1 hypothetical protein [Roseobacter litoralis]
MAALESAKVQNRIKISTIALAIVIYLVLIGLTAGLILPILLVTGLITHFVIKKEISMINTPEVSFRKRFPFSRYGAAHGSSFQHLFYHEQNILAELSRRVTHAMSDRLHGTQLVPVVVTDEDKDLSAKDPRHFQVAHVVTTDRGTAINLIVQVGMTGKTQSLRWWILLGGFIDRDKRLRVVLASPLTFWFWIIPYLKRDYPMLDKVRTVYKSTYNDFDITTQTRAVNEIVFQVLVDVLEENDIDTSDLKAQRLQAMNINISGGKVEMGNVVQGGMNTIMNKMGGGQK